MVGGADLALLRAAAVCPVTLEALSDGRDESCAFAGTIVGLAEVELGTAGREEGH